MFNISRLITNPNPGTSVFPAGTVGVGDGAVLLSCGDCEVDWDVVSVFVFSDVLDACAAGASAGGGAAATGGGSAAGGVGSGGGGAGAGGGGAITVVDRGLAGLTGLDMLVGFVALLTHMFDTSIQDPACG